jgi:ABC-type nitrate/sulfonate/bicarbonate transport system permease component
MMARTDLVIVGMIVITVIGAILNKILSTIEHAVVKGRHMQ